MACYRCRLLLCALLAALFSAACGGAPAAIRAEAQQFYQARVAEGVKSPDPSKRSEWQRRNTGWQFCQRGKDRSWVAMTVEPGGGHWFWVIRSHWTESGYEVMDWGTRDQAHPELDEYQKEICGTTGIELVRPEAAVGGPRGSDAASWA